MSLLNPRSVVEAGIVTGLNSDKQIQPNAIEMTADRIFKVDGKTWLLTEDDKQHRDSHEIFPNTDGVWVLDPNSVYDIMSNLYVAVPEGMAALVNIRSTLNRAGIRLSTGVWDSGFKGNLGAILHTPSGCEFELGVGTRVAQVLFLASDSEGAYEGGYNTAKGEHWQSATGRVSGTSPNTSNTPKQTETCYTPSELVLAATELESCEIILGLLDMFTLVQNKNIFSCIDWCSRLELRKVEPDMIRVGVLYTLSLTLNFGAGGSYLKTPEGQIPFFLVESK